jgi:hypothetical protein
VQTFSYVPYALQSDVKQLGLHCFRVPLSMVNLEVWIPPDISLIEFTDAYQVKDCGMVAPAGR